MKLRRWFPYIVFVMGVSAVCLLVIALRIFAALPDNSDHACTLLACISVISVEFTGDIPAEYTVEVVGSDGKTWHTVCKPDSRGELGLGCQESGIGIPGMDFGPEHLTITIRWDNGSVTQTFKPDYEVWYANGRDCPPVCYSAELRMRLG